MPKRITLLVSVVFTSLVAAVALTAQLGHAESSIKECISAPNSAPPRGSHWYYRVDRASRRRCWYLGSEGMKVRQPAPLKRQSPARLTSLPTPRPILPTIAQSPAAESPAVAIASENSSVVAFFSARWPALRDSIGSFYGGPARPLSNDDNVYSATDPQDDMPLIWPILTLADIAAAEQPPEPTVRFGYLLAALIGAVSLIALTVHACRKLAARRFGHLHRRYANNSWSHIRSQRASSTSSSRRARSKRRTCSSAINSASALRSFRASSIGPSFCPSNRSDTCGR
jgi:hypothetical protein